MMHEDDPVVGPSQHMASYVHTMFFLSHGVHTQNRYSIEVSVVA
jgi:hypothetical protein